MSENTEIKLAKNEKKKFHRTLFQKIVNFFLSIILFILVLVLLLIGFTQTSYFRNIVKNQIITNVNSQIQGRIYIESISGSFFTTLEINKFGLIAKSDTVFKAEKFNLRLDIWAIIQKKIKLKEINLLNPEILLVEDEKEDLTIEKAIYKPDSTIVDSSKIVVKNEEKTPFPFQIEISELRITNGKFSFKDFAHSKVDSTYNYLNTKDFSISEWNLSFALNADINKNIYSLNLRELEFSTNLKRFQLNDFNGKINISPEKIMISNLNLISDNSDLLLNAEISKLNLFDKIVYENFGDYPVKLSLQANPFHFDDLTSFLPEIDFLKGPIYGEIEASGKYGDLKIEKLDLAIDRTELFVKGEIKNLENPKKLWIDAQFRNSRINYDEVEYLLSGLELPNYSNVELENLSAAYQGETDVFIADLKGNFEKGEFSAKTKFDFRKKDMKYDISLVTKNLDLKKIIEESTSLNLNAKLNGIGINPAKMTNSAEIIIKNSNYGQNFVNELSLIQSAKQGQIAVELLSQIEETLIGFDANIDISKKNPVLSAYSSFNKLNLGKLLADETLNSDLNFNLNFNIKLDSTQTVTNSYFQNMNGELEMTFDSSKFKNSYALSDKKIDLTMWTDELGQNLDLQSEILDAKISGKFTFSGIAKIITSQIDRISNTIKAELSDDLIEKEFEKTEIVKDLSNVNFNFVFKDAEILAHLFDFQNFSANGYFHGEIINDSTDFKIYANSYFSNFLFNNSDDLYYFDNLSLTMNVKNSNLRDELSEIEFDLLNSADRFFVGENITNSIIDIDFFNEKLLFNTTAIIDSNLNVDLGGDFVFKESSQQLAITHLEASQGKAKIRNLEPFFVTLSDSGYTLQNVNLELDSAQIKLDGIYSHSGFVNFNLATNNLDLFSLFSIIETEETPKIAGKIDLLTKISGKTENPKIDVNFLCKDFGFDNVNFGDISFTNHLENFKTNFDLKLSKIENDVENIILSSKGYIPLPISELSEKFVLKSDEMDVKIETSGFNIKALGNIIPAIEEQNGLLASEIGISGTIFNPILNGFANLENSKFTIKTTGLNYNLSSSINLENNLITIKQMQLSNTDRKLNDKKLSVIGSIKLDSYELSDLNIDIYGTLALLSEESKKVSPNYYGDLVIATDGRMKVEYQNQRVVLKGGIVVKDANLTIVSASSNENVSESDIIYEYKQEIKDSIKTDEILLDEILLEKIKNASKPKTDENVFLNYDLDLIIENRALLNFVLSKAANQKLSVITNGSLKLKNIDGISSVQGVFNLLQGSQLEFLRTFDATGFIRFERELDNPYLEIIAVYQGTYIQETSDNETEEMVAVKIKLAGLLSDLGKSITEDKKSISVYVGKKNIDSNIPDPKLEASDAFSFILFNKFNSNLTSNEQFQLSSELSNAATAMLGTVMAGFINSQVGDVVKDIQLKQTTTTTRLTVKGRVGQFFYSLGGDLNAMQDISQANWKAEYFFSKNLSFRIERREPITGYFSGVKMTDEMAIKYRVSF